MIHEHAGSTSVTLLHEFTHPASLNAFQRFRQSRFILKETSRATQPAWYLEALELDYQTHIRVDGSQIDVFFYNRPKDEWIQGPPLSESAFTREREAVDFGSQLLKLVRSMKGSSLGVIVHIADEFSTAELNPELSNPASLTDLREAAYHTPGEVLDDSSIPPDQASWRVLPYPASGSELIGTTVSLSRRLGAFLSSLRELGKEQNFPIITHALSSPLVALTGIPQIITHSGENPVVVVLQYPWFTMIAFLSERLELRLIRSLPHRGLRRPVNFSLTLSTTNASLEFVEPDIYVVPLGEDVDKVLPDDLERNFPDSQVETVLFQTPAGVPDWIPEPSLSVEPLPKSDEGLSQTFGALIMEKWFLQDFLPAPREVLEIMPTRNEMKLLRLLKLARVAVFLLSALGIVWLAMGVFSLRSRPEWSFNEDDARLVQGRLGALTQERTRIDHWNNLLEDRSKAWSSMEALARIFPPKSGLLVKTFAHTVRPDSAAGLAKVGFVKEWQITGWARDGALDYLNSLNSREGISGKFAEIAQLTGNSAYDPTPGTRTLVVNVRTQESSAFKRLPEDENDDSNEATFPYTFSLTVTQRFESADGLAITATKAP